MAETPVQQAIREADEICQAAINATPEQYRAFIIMLPQSKKIGTQYANIKLPYMSAEGRVLMAIDDHRKHGCRITYDPAFISIDGEAVCRCTVTSSMLGTSTAHSTVLKEDKAREKAETRAKSRALEGFGYGIFGLKSFNDESADYISEFDESAESIDTVADDRATPKQIGLLCSKLEAFGCRPGTRKGFLEWKYPEGMNKTDCSKALDIIQTKNQLPPNWYNRYIEYLGESAGIEKSTIGNWMETQFGERVPNKLSPENKSKLIDWIMSESGGKPESPSDIYTPSAPIAIETLVAHMAEAIGVKPDTFEKWVVETYGRDSDLSIHDLEPYVVTQLRAIDLDTLRERVTEYAAREQS